MRFKMMSLAAAAVLSAACSSLRADPIDYSLLPSDPMGYAHFDTQQIFRVYVTQFGKDKPGLEKRLNLLPTSVTAVYCRNGEFIVLVRAQSAFRQKLQQLAEGVGTMVSVHYGDKTIYNFALPAELQDGSLKEKLKLELKNTSKVNSQTVEKLFKEFASRSVYVSVVDEHNLIVIGFDFRTVISELEIIAGKVDSMAKRDPAELKIEAPGALAILSADATAKPANDESTATTSESTDTPFGSLLSLDLTRDLQENVKRIQIIITNDGPTLNVDGKVLLKDDESAQKLQRLAMGVKALVSIAEPEKKTFLDAMTATAEKTSTLIHWNCPLDMLPTIGALIAG